MANCFYNGVELPELPDFSQYNTEHRGDFEYAFIYKNGQNEYALLVYTEPLCKRHRPSPYDDDVIQDIAWDKCIYYCAYEIVNGEWKEHGGFLTNPILQSTENAPAINYTYGNYEIIWCNHDIMDYDTGAIHFAASDPVPVPDVPDTPDPTGAPISPYVRKNEAWQKQDVYKRAGDQWVKQAQDGYQAQGGQWPPL